MQDSNLFVIDGPEQNEDIAYVIDEGNEAEWSEDVVYVIE